MPKPPELLTLPGAIDLHVHCREPGNNKAETIESATYAAALGGLALIADMPNNEGNPTWTVERMVDKRHIARRNAHVAMAFWAGSQPESNNESELPGLAIRAIGLKSYLGHTTGNPNEYQAEDFFEIWRAWDKLAPHKPIGVHRGSAYLPDIIEFVAGELGHHLHVHHTNDPEEVAAVGRAKKRGWPVTIGVCPDHLFKTSHDLIAQGKFAERMPPLAHQFDAEQLLYLYRTGNIDNIESDHAPHSKERKLEAEAKDGDCFGVAGIDFMPILIRQMVKGELSLRRLVASISEIPAAILGIKLSPQTFTKWDVSQTYLIDGSEPIHSACGHTPYLNMLGVGRLVESQIAGQTVVRNGMIAGRRPLVLEERGSVL